MSVHMQHAGIENYMGPDLIYRYDQHSNSPVNKEKSIQSESKLITTLQGKTLLLMLFKSARVPLCMHSSTALPRADLAMVIAVKLSLRLHKYHFVLM